MLSPAHLHTLAVVLRVGSFADAARQLGYTGSAVSQQMAALERSVKMPLFTRSAHAICPTPMAHMLSQRSAPALGAWMALERDLEAMASGDLGYVRVGVFPTVSRRIVPAWLPVHHDRHPDVVVDIDEDEPPVLIERLLRAEVDIALVYRYDRVPQRWPSELASVRLMSEDLVLLLPVAHAATSPRAASTLPADAVSLADLSDADWIATREGTPGAQCLTHLCASSGFSPRIRYRSNDYGVIRELVSAGLGVACVPSLAYDPVDRIRPVPLTGLGVRRHIFALTRKDGRRPAVGAVVAGLRRTCADYPSGG